MQTPRLPHSDKIKFKTPLKVAWLTRVRILGAALLTATALDASSVRIVDFGDDYAFHGGLPTYRQGIDGYGVEEVQPSENTTFDVDGDGQTDDDSYAYHKFSTTVPLNVTEPFHNTDGNSAVFYGGLTSFFANQTTYWSEGGINIDHGRDDHNFHSYSRGSGTGVQAWGVWLWKKEDFLNKGDAHSVSFSADSKMGVYVSRYWEDWEEGRFVVKDNGQYYISEHAFGPGRSTLYELAPNSSRWAPYNPSEAEPYDPSSVAFDASSASFSNHSFTNIEEVGWYIAKPTLSEAQLWLKWYGFEVHAEVNAPATPSINIPMTRVVAGTGDDGLYMADSEVSYEQWRKVYKWAARNAYAISRGFMFDKDGDMGSMDLATATHGPDEPVTDITWSDAVLWCNALSIYEGLDPVYYADASLTTPLHEVIVRTDEATMFDNLPIYVDWSANGFRLPTLKEWQDAASGASGAEASAWTAANAGGKTQAVATKTAADGLYDLIGNVWEFTWDRTADSYDPTVANVRTVVGGDFSLPADVSSESGPETLKSSPKIGFRPVRVIGTASTPDKTSPFASTLGYTQSAQIPVWRFNEAVAITNPAAPGAGSTAPTMITLPSGSFDRNDGATVSITGFSMSETEITYAKWMEVYNWAVANGYQFNRDGDMGSMDYLTAGKSHGPNEPVTEIAYEDALLFCNALSEMEERTPAYYVDEGLTNVFREALAFRLNESPERTTIWTYGELWDSSKTMRTRYLKWDSDGYRLPSIAEWEYAARSGENSTLFPWGASFDGAYGWDADNSGLRTQAVGQKTALSNGLKDTSGNVFEWTWGGGYSYYYNDDPRGDGSPNLRGGSFRISGTGSAAEAPLLSPSGRTSDPFGYIKPGHAYPEVGFRIIHTTAGAHPAQEPPYTPDVVLDIDPATQDILSGQTYRGDMHRTGQYSDPGPSAQTAPNLKWSFAASDAVSASPIVFNGTVFVGDEAGMLYALDVNDGSVIWSADTGESSIYSTPTVAHGHVYVIAGRRIIAYDVITGDIVFNVNGNFGGRYLNPAVIGDVVFWNEGWDDLVALDAFTGEQLWRHRDSVGVGKGTSSPVIADGQVFWCSGAQGFYAADVRTERRDWFYDAAVDNWVQTPAFYDGFLYTVGSKGIISIDVSASVDGKYDNPTWSNDAIHYESQAPKFSSPAVDADSVYIGNAASSDGSQYNFLSFDRLTGVKEWTFATGGANNGSPALAGGSVFFGSADGKVYSLDKSDGSLNWDFSADGPVSSSPVISGGILLFGSDNGTVYAIDSAPSISSEPQDVTINDGESTTLSVTASGIGTLSYQWYQGTAGDTSLPVVGATASSFTTPSLGGEIDYWVRVTDSEGVFSDSRTITVVVIVAPMVETQPQSTSLLGGESATLSVSASGGNLSYQWYEGSSGDTSSPISGANASSYTTPALASSSSFWVRVSNSVDTADSNTAVITISPPAPSLKINLGSALAGNWNSYAGFDHFSGGSNFTDNSLVFEDGAAADGVSLQVARSSTNDDWHEAFNGLTLPAHPGEWLTDSAAISAWGVSLGPETITFTIAGLPAGTYSIEVYTYIPASAVGNNESGTRTYPGYKLDSAIMSAGISGAEAYTTTDFDSSRYDLKDHGTQTLKWEDITVAEGTTLNVIAANMTNENLGINAIYIRGGKLASGGTFSSWVEDYNLPNGSDGPTHDPDGDGMSNLLEYALMSEPHQANSGGGMAAQMVEDQEQQFFDLTFSRRKDLSDATLTIRSSTDLSDWTSAKVLPAGTNPTADTDLSILAEDADAQELRYRHPMSEETLFFTIEVTTP